MKKVFKTLPVVESTQQVTPSAPLSATPVNKAPIPQYILLTLVFMSQKNIRNSVFFMPESSQGKKQSYERRTSLAINLYNSTLYLWVISSYVGPGNI